MKTFGAIRYDEQRAVWVVRCEPHVSTRLKRVFAGINKDTVGTFAVTDTPDHARDLEWFMERYPLEMDEGGRARLSRQSVRHREQQSIVEALLANRTAPAQFDLAIPPREYQRTAASLLLATGRLLLADDVGLGKTASAICTFADPSTLPTLVVTLTHLPRQWETEIKRFAPALATHVIRKGTPYDLTARKTRTPQPAFADRFPDVVIINYHKLSGWAETLAPVIRSVVFDECQELRHGGTAKYKAARHLCETASFRMGLSATPIYNYGGEIYNVLNCLAPDCLGSYEEFVTEWCNVGYSDKPRLKDPKAFGMFLRDNGLMLRRTRADVGRELPPLTRITHAVESHPAALNRVGHQCAELARLILQRGEAHRGQKMMASEEFSNRLRQATGIAKAPYVAQFVRMLVENGEPVVLYGWHREVYDLWLALLADLKPVMYTGTESPTQKQKARDAFIAGESQVLMMSLRSGAGLDGLQGRGRTVVFGELDWSPGVLEQCMGRIHRDGQADPVVAYYLVAEDGADPIMAEVLGLKKSQIDGLRDMEGGLIEKLEVGEGHIRRLAEAYLQRKGEGTRVEGAA